MKRFLFRNFGWKLGSLILATLTWFVARDYSLQSREGGRRVIGRNYGEPLRLPIQIMTSPHDSHSYRANPPLASVRFEGAAPEEGGASAVRLFVAPPDTVEGGSGRFPIQVYAGFSYRSAIINPAYVELEATPRGGGASSGAAQSNDEEF